MKSLKKHKILGKIDFINVNFNYPSRKEQIVKNLNLHIKEGEKVALVGSSGSGKSTLLHILARLYPITSGKILIDGHLIEKYNLRELRKKLGILSQ
jgi:ABC-type multidrug transport system fused ATPase/permease subunit